MYDQFDKAVTDVKPMGEDSVDGDKAYKYELTLDTKAMGESLPGDTGAKIPDTITYLALGRRGEPPPQGHLRHHGVQGDDDDEQVRRARRHHRAAGCPDRQGTDVTGA